MRYRRFGRTGWNVSEIGYGMWGMAGWTGSEDRKSTRLNSSHSQISNAVFCLKKKKIHIFLRILGERLLNKYINFLIVARLGFGTVATVLERIPDVGQFCCVESGLLAGPQDFH